MIKRILVPLDASLYCEKSIEQAITVAKIHDAEITGLVILDIKGINKSVGPVPAGAAYYAKKLEKNKVKVADNLIKSLLNKFEEKCKDAKAKYLIHERQGLPSKKILEESMFYDLLVIGKKTYYEFDADKDKGGASFEEILDHSITPILTVPANFHAPNLEKSNVKVLISYDGSLPCSRSVQRFAQLAGLVGKNIEIHVVMSHDNEKLAGHYLMDIKKYLKAHNFNNVHTVYTPENVKKFIGNNYLDWADMYVLGAHSQKGLTEYLTGSYTKYLINNTNAPIFIGQ